MVRGATEVEYFGEGTLETRAILKFGLSSPPGRQLWARFSEGLPNSGKSSSPDGACSFRNTLPNRVGFKNRYHARAGRDFNLAEQAPLGQFRKNRAGRKGVEKL